MSIMFNMKTEMKADDVTPSVTVSRNNSKNFPPSRGQKTQESVEADPGSSVTSHVTPLQTEHPESAAATEVRPQNDIASRLNQSSSSDMRLPKTDDYRSSSNMSNSDIQTACNILSLENKDDFDCKGRGISHAPTDESDVFFKLLSLNTSDIEPGESIVSNVSVRQNASEMTAVRRGVKKECPPTRSQHKQFISQESFESSTTDTGMKVLSEFRSSYSLESNLQRYTQIISDGTFTRESQVPVIDNEFSKIEENVFNCDTSINDLAFPEFLKVMWDGRNVCGDTGYPLDVKPGWFDLDKFRRGQRVAMKYLFGLQLAEMLSLLMIFSFPGSLLPLIFTGKSDTPYKSFKRYLSTVTRVRSWYSDDIWQPGTEGHRNIEIVRTMHRKTRQELHNTKSDELSKKVTLSGKCTISCKGAAIWSPLYEKIREDFQGSCPYRRPNPCPFPCYQRNGVFMNQMEMALTQFGFVGLFILFPEKFGAHGISDEDMNAFVYLWRCLGYILGTDDRYNICNGDLETVRQRSRDVINFWVKPTLRDISRDWEHMTRCVVQGINVFIPGITFEIALLYLCSMLDINAPRLRAALTFTQEIFYYLMNLVFLVLMRLPGTHFIFNCLLSWAIRQAQIASPAQLSKLHKKHNF